MSVVAGLTGIPFRASAADSDLKRLDRMLDTDYVAMRVNRIDSMRRELLNHEEKWRADYEMAGLYADFNVDSALLYLRRAREAAPDEAARRAVMLRQGSIYNGSLVMYKEAADIFRSLSPDPADSTFTRDYFTFGVQLCRNLEELAPEPDVREEYARMKRDLRDSVLRYSPASLLIDANRLLDNGNPAGALRLLLPEVEGEGFSPANGAVYHVIARAYEMQGNRGKEIEYLTLAAQSDVSNGVREYIALPRLAYLLYESGDVDRAYRYMQRSIDDARACNARLRLMDMSETMSVISGANAAKERSARRLLVLLLLIVAVSLAVVGVSLYYARRKNRQLAESRRRLESLNSRLEASGNLREKYARRFMRLSMEYIDKLDHYRRHLLKIASRRKFDDLYDAISSTAGVERESDLFYRNFDSAFLELYPDFVAEFNCLLRPEERVVLKDERSLNTELRIFALMKMGIGESAEIARLLHCSQSTVYNYRTRYRSKAIDKNEFVRKVFPDDATSAPTL